MQLSRERGALNQSGGARGRAGGGGGGDLATRESTGCAGHDHQAAGGAGGGKDWQVQRKPNSQVAALTSQLVGQQIDGAESGDQVSNVKAKPK